MPQDAKAKAIEQWARDLHYDAVTGHLMWHPWARRRGRQMGVPVGCVDRSKGGYVVLFAPGGKAVSAHRVAFFLMTGRWPTEVDHINGVRSDNRWANLREVPHRSNSQNRRKLVRENTASGLLGVETREAKNGRLRHRAAIWIDGKRRSVGTFDSPHDAQDAYIAAKRKNHPGTTL